MRDFIDRLFRDRTGSSVVETAIILPTLLSLMAGASDLSMGYYTKTRTQQAAARAIELAHVGGLEKLSVDDVKNEAAAAAGVSTSNVVVNRWLECNGVTQPLFEGACNDGEVVGRYVTVKVTNSYRPIFGPLLPKGMIKGGSIAFTGSSSLRLQ